MLVMDIPDLPPQYAQVVVAQASQRQKGDAKTDRTIGICHLAENPPIPPDTNDNVKYPPISRDTAVNIISPVGSASDYFGRVERRKVGIEGKATILQAPEHGTLKDEGPGEYRYIPKPNYLGHDRATLLVEIGALRVRVVYFFRVQLTDPGGTEGYDPYKDKRYCPNGMFWKISLPRSSLAPLAFHETATPPSIYH